MEGENLGDALYRPTFQAEIGDIAYFDGGTYHVLFNAYRMTEQVTLPDAD